MRYPTSFVLLMEDTLSIDLTLSAERVINADSPDTITSTLGQTAKMFRMKRSSRPRLPLAHLPSSRHRAYLAERTLRRALRSEPSFISINHNRCRLLPDDGFINCYARLLSRPDPSSTVTDTVNGPLFIKPEVNKITKLVFHLSLFRYYLTF